MYQLRRVVQRLPGYSFSTIAVTCALAVIFSTSVVHGETKTYCDDMCGQSVKCQVVCCFITTTSVEGVEIVTGLSCNQTACCAHPTGTAIGAGSTITIPSAELPGIEGTVKGGLLGKGIDVSSLKVEVDSKQKTLTLTGKVPSLVQKENANVNARKLAKGYKVVDRLIVSPRVAQESLHVWVDGLGRRTEKVRCDTVDR